MSSLSLSTPRGKSHVSTMVPVQSTDAGPRRLTWRAPVAPVAYLDAYAAYLESFTSELYRCPVDGLECQQCGSCEREHRYCDQNGNVR